MREGGGQPSARAPIPDQLKREIGLFDATMVVAGSVIGVGIFTTTGFVAASLPHPALLLAAWVVGGLLSLAGALSNAEMGASLPHAGGDYVYLREAFHPAMGFFAGWLTFLVVFCGTVATLAAGFAESVAGFAPWASPARHWWTAGSFRIGPAQLVALVPVWACTALCAWGVREGARTQSAITAAKLAAIAALCLAGPLIGSGSWSGLLEPGAGAVEVSRGPLQGLSAFGLAMVPILFAYLGWNAPVYIASELRDPSRTLPRALLLGTLLCTAVYVVLNAVYLYAVPVASMFTLAPDGRREGIVRIAALAASNLFGPIGGALISALVLASILGCLNATILVGARIAYAMALDRTLPVALAGVHAVRGTPAVALYAQSVVATALLLNAGFEQVLTYTTFAVITLMILDGLALYWLRRRDLPRPYRVWGFPWVPGIYVLASLGLWLNTLLQRPVESLIGLAIAASAFPVYWLGRSRRAPPRRGHRVSPRPS